MKKQITPTILILLTIIVSTNLVNALENNETFTQKSYYTNSTSLLGANHIAGNSTNVFITGYNGNSITELEVIGGTLTQKSYYANASSIGGANGVCTNGQGIIFITGFTGGTLTTFNSTSGTLIQTNVYTNATSITNPYDCKINGNYLYVSDYGSSGIVSFDITNPNNPIQIDYQVNETILTAINSLFIMNNTLYATAESGSSTTSIWNITGGTPSLLNWSVGVANPYRLTGNYGELLFVGSYTNQVDGTIQVYNVSNKKLELINPTYTNSTTYASLRGLANIQNYLFAVGAGSNTTTLLRINNDGTLTQIKYLQNDTSTYFPNDIIASGLRAFVVGYSGNSVAMFEITNSTTPPFCQLNNDTNVMFCDDAEGTNDICDTQYWGYGGYADCLRQNMTYSTEKPFQGSKSILTPTNIPTEEGQGWVYGDFSFLNMTTSAFEINFDIYYQKNASDTYFNPQHSIEGSGAGTYWSVGYYPTFGSDDYLTCFFGFTTCENLTFTANTWHHYNITTDGSTLILYLNGVEAGRADGVSGVYNFLMDSIGAQSQAETADDKLYMDNFIITQKTLTLPNIASFTTTNDTILNGTSTQLDWSVNYATDLDLNGVNVSGLTAYNVSPIINTTYTLTATNENGSVNANLTINVYYPPPCTPIYYCAQLGSCNITNKIPCLNVSDMNECGTPYNPSNYSDYEQNCTYTQPSQGYSPTYANTDLVPSVYDFIIGIFAGLAGIALLLGLGVGLSIFAKSDTGRTIMKNLKR